MAFWGNFFKKDNKVKQAGNVFMMLFAAVGMVGVIGAATMTVMKGPVRTMSQVTQRTIAENNMIAAGKLAVIAASRASSDCDADNTIEPFEYVDAIPGFTGGGTIPANIGVSKEDPWGNAYGYCVWDHGTAIDDAGCGGAGQKRLAGKGGALTDQYVLAIVSAGPDGNFSTSCDAYVNDTTPILNKTGGTDDIVLGYTYAEAGVIAGGIWSEDGTTGATIARDIVIKDKTTGLTDAFSFNSDTAALTLGAGGSGSFPTIGTDNLRAFAGVGGTINVLSALSSDSNIITTANISGVDLAASGTLGVTGATSLSTLGTSGLATLNSATITNNATVGGTLGVTGATSLSTLGTSGLATLDSATITNNATVGGTLGVTGATSLSTLGTSGLATLDSATITNNATVGGTFGVTGATSLAGLSAGITTLGATTLSGNLAMGANAITGVADPTAAQDAATKAYVDTNIAAGTGFTESDPQVGTITTGKWCVSNGGGTAIDCTANTPAGDNLGNHTATTDLNLATNKIVNLVDPTAAQDGATKSYVDTVISAGPTCTEAAETWVSQTASAANFWFSVTYGGGQFVAVSGSGANQVMTSPDGITWASRTAAEANTWQSITYGGGQFVAVSGSGANRVMTSPDGITWTSRTAAQANNWQSITYGGGQFVAVSGSGANRVMTSPDGITWTSRTAAQANNWRSVTYDGGQFVAVSSDGTNRVMTSPDGITWTSRTAAEANTWFSVTYGGGQFVAVSGSGTNRVMTSPDGITWTSRTAAEANIWFSVTYGGGQFVAVSYDGTNRVMTSPDGITWTSRTAAEANTWFSVTYGGGQFVAVSADGTNRVMTSDVGVCDNPYADNLGDHTATTALDMASNKIINVTTPTAAQDAATKAYVDAQVGSSKVIKDTDGNTQIQVEEGANDDTIRFDTNGVERMIINPSGRMAIGNGATTAQSMYSFKTSSTDDIKTLLVDGGGDGVGEDVFVAMGKHASLFAGDVIRAEVNRSSGTGFNLISTVVDADGTPSYPFTVRGDGNVGIGDKNPVDKFQVSGGGISIKGKISNTINVGGLFLDFDSVSNNSRIVAGNISDSSLTLSTNNLGLTYERMRIDKDGKVGIGTISPATKLQVAGATAEVIRADVLATDNFAVSSSSVYSSTHAPLFIGYRGRGTPAVPTFTQSGDSLANFEGRSVGVTGPLTGAGMRIVATENHSAGVMGSELYLKSVPNGTKTAIDRMIITQDGKVGIGTSTPAAKLHVVGDIQYTGVITDISDERLKENIQPLNKSGSLLDQIDKIKTVSFSMKDDPKHKIEYGVLAQQIEEIFPELVNTADDEMKTKSVNYIGLIAPLVESVKELKAQNEIMMMHRESKDTSSSSFMAFIMGLLGFFAGAGFVWFLNRQSRV